MQRISVRRTLCAAIASIPGAMVSFGRLVDEKSKDNFPVLGIGKNAGDGSSTLSSLNITFLKQLHLSKIYAMIEYY